MEAEFWEAVRERANTLWLEEGCPEGKSDQHWQQAQHDVLASVPLSASKPSLIRTGRSAPLVRKARAEGRVG